ncbi:hypothetical protein H2198_005607 [Neophaeococcomyces mojaviensis]|uniref:Uncharacterized protein n=1 Tax=Neophaeococcomyces mojaviensis TaxID=3383035 RepID=A0ACC3A572_9EURO|nr:hypothetical protein H2198_005607 [Knufia sp. JES_112]
MDISRIVASHDTETAPSLVPLEQITKKLKRSIDEVSSTVPGPGPSLAEQLQPPAPSHIYIVKVTTTQAWSEVEEASIIGAYGSLQDANNAAQDEAKYSWSTSYTKWRKEWQEEIAASGCMTLQQSNDEVEDEVTIEVEAVRFWAPGSVVRRAPAESESRTAGGEEFGSEEEEDEEEDDEY